MYEWLYGLTVEFGLSRHNAGVALALTAVVVAALCVLLRGVAGLLLGGLARRLAAGGKHPWITAALSNRLPARLANLVVPVVIAQGAEGIPSWLPLLEKSAGIAGVVVFLLLFQSVAAMANELYTRHEISKTRPIKGILQVAQVVVYIVAGVAGVAILMGESPLVLLGGIGAMAAVVSFVFKDPILGFVAGIQLTANDMIRIGDWIEMPKYSADGDVVEISMTTVKVRNFDNTVTSIPAYTLVSDAFVNWRGMSESGGRRIKRALYIEADGVRLCDDEMNKKFSDMTLIKDYMTGKLAEVAAWNEARGGSGPPPNTRGLTNLGTLRAYMAAYMRQHPGIRQDMTVMVRQLAPGEAGIPLEVYAFTSTTAWGEYEDIQADIFDHFYSVVPFFGLAVYQKPSSGDLRGLAR